MSQVLDTLFVDITARGMKEAEQAVTALRERVKDATAAHRAMRAEMDKAASGPQQQRANVDRGAERAPGRQTTPTANSPSLQSGPANALQRLAVDATLAATALRQLRGDASGVRVADPLSQARRVEGAVPKARLVDGERRPPKDEGIGGQLKQVGIAFAAVGAAVAPLIAMIRQGLQGTVELERFSQAMAAVSREVATLIGPPLRMAADMILQAVNVFRQMGPAAQQLLGVFLGIGVVGQVLSDPALKSAMTELGAAFSDLMLASRPLINQLAFLTSSLIKVGIVTPLVMFAQLLTVAAHGLARFTEYVVKGMQMFGLGFTMKTRGTRDELRLNQTGTEDAQASFARIQEAVLRAGGGGDTEEVKQTNYLKQIYDDIHDLWEALRPKLKLEDAPRAIANSPPGQFAEGAADAGVFGPGGMLGAMALRWARK